MRNGPDTVPDKADRKLFMRCPLPQMIKQYILVQCDDVSAIKNACRSTYNTKLSGYAVCSTPL